MNQKRDTAKKPIDWPANKRECLIENLARAMENFKKDPTPITRENIVSFTYTFDLNQRHSIGVFRVTEYEIMQINTLYLNASHYQFSSVKSLLYELVAETTQIHKLTYQMSMSNMNIPKGVATDHIDVYLGMMRPLLIFHVAYQDYLWEKKHSFCEHLIHVVQTLLLEHIHSADDLAHWLVVLLHDFGTMRGTKREALIRFTRDELLELFKLEADLLKASGQNPIQRPLKGMMMIQLSNLILKSRNGYHEGLVYKCIPTQTAIDSINNGQIWMRKVEQLNDDRECCVVSELLKNACWLKMPWLDRVDLKPTRLYFVSSFSKTVPDEQMRLKYGTCVYGFKGDKLTELIGLLEKRHWVKCDKVTGIEVDAYDDYALEQVVAMDVLYGRTAAREELLYVCRVIDLMPMTQEEKRAFFEELIQYWILSVKDEKWASEKERRYVLFTHADTEYVGTESDESYLKVPTTMFQYPDVLLGDNPIKKRIKLNVDEKRKVTPGSHYFFCHNCLLRDRDLAVEYKKIETCPICGSKDIEIVP